MNNIITRKGRAEDAQDFSHLILLSAPTFFPQLFASNAVEVIRNLFQQPGNLFSFEHSYFIEVNSKRAGMVLGYNWKQKRREELYTGLLLVKYLKWSLFSRIFYLLKAQNIVGKVAENEYYLSNIAVYPEYRGLGLGTKLLLEIERESRKTGSNKIVLDVDTSNERALKLYERLGYIIEKRAPCFKINKETFDFFRMYRILEQDGNVA
ncbi:MAG: GNAT family N-acetyltransferase [Candidatus Atribacteria bacterium]|nr:GNAT family N-acetyltransferase [Candidatus Atribacteria bacterium]